jgi:hypothetical protein
MQNIMQCKEIFCLTLSVICIIICPLKINALTTSNSWKYYVFSYIHSLTFFLCIVENLCVDYMNVPGFEL